MFIISIVLYNGKKPWKWKLSFLEALGGKDFLKIPVSFRKNMLNFNIRLLDVSDPKLEKALRDKSFKSRGALYLLREVWTAKADLAFLRRVFGLFHEVLRKRDDLVLSVAEYLTTGYKMSAGMWREAESEAVKQGLLKKGGYMDIRKHIEERGRQKGWRKGLKEGQQEGRREGLKEGRRERDKEVTLSMLKRKLSASLISEVTGLSEEEIKKLKNGK